MSAEVPIKESFDKLNAVVVELAAKVDSLNVVVLSDEEKAAVNTVFALIKRLIV